MKQLAGLKASIKEKRVLLAQAEEKLKEGKSRAALDILEMEKIVAELQVSSNLLIARFEFSYAPNTFVYNP